MHVKFFVLLLKVKEEKLWKHILSQMIPWSLLDQICQRFLNLCHLKVQLINLTFCCFTQSLQIWSLQKAKTRPVNIHLKHERKSFFSFFGAIQVLTSCTKFASHRCPMWHSSWSGNGLLLLQRDEHQLHFLVLSNSRCISYLQDHLFKAPIY